MIRSFADSDTEQIWQRKAVKRIGPELTRSTRKKLIVLDAASDVNDLRYPLATGLRSCPETAQASIAFGSTYNGASASPGQMALRTLN